MESRLRRLASNTVCPFEQSFGHDTVARLVDYWYQCRCLQNMWDLRKVLVAAVSPVKDHLDDKLKILALSSFGNIVASAQRVACMSGELSDDFDELIESAAKDVLVLLLGRQPRPKELERLRNQLDLLI